MVLIYLKTSFSPISLLRLGLEDYENVMGK